MKKNQVKLNKLSESCRARSKVIAIMNNKGGCGKTTTTIALGLHLARAGNNVMFWDMDPQSNLTQRLGIPDAKYRDRRLNEFFRNMDKDSFDEDQRKLPIIIKYPYFYRLQGSLAPPGSIAIMAGSHVAEIDAAAALKKLDSDPFIMEPERRNMYLVVRKTIDFYRDYFDYIIMDSAPAMEGNALGQLTARLADEVVIPIDGLEAAMGVAAFNRWLYAETSPEKNVINRPNLVYAMIKYQDDTKNIMDEISGDGMRNAVYLAMKDALGNYVCDEGIKELPSLRNKVYGGFGKKNAYEEVCNEIIHKISMPRTNFFVHWNQIVAAKLDKNLSKIGAKTLQKQPEFKNPYYQAINGVDSDADLSA